MRGEREKLRETKQRERDIYIYICREEKNKNIEISREKKKERDRERERERGSGEPITSTAPRKGFGRVKNVADAHCCCRTGGALDRLAELG